MLGGPSKSPERKPNFISCLLINNYQWKCPADLMLLIYLTTLGTKSALISECVSSWDGGQGDFGNKAVDNKVKVL